MARAVIMDGDESVRAQVRHDLELAGVEVVASAADAPAAVWCWDEYRPDFVVLGQPLGGPSAFDAATVISVQDPTARVVVFRDWSADLSALAFERTVAA